MRARCDEDAALGVMSEGGTRKKHASNGDPEDMKAERNGKLRISGLLLHMDEDSLQRTFRRCRQTKRRKRWASLIARPYCQTLQASTSYILQRTCSSSFFFLQCFLFTLTVLQLVKPKPLIEHQIKRACIRKAFFIPAFEQSWHFTYIHNTDQLKGFTGQISPPGYLYP